MPFVCFLFISETALTHGFIIQNRKAIYTVSLETETATSFVSLCSQKKKKKKKVICIITYSFPQSDDFLLLSFYLLLEAFVFANVLQCILNILNTQSLFQDFFLFMATPVVYGSSQARGQIRATAASLHHSHTRSEPHI